MQNSELEKFNALQSKMRACKLCLDDGHDVEPPAVTQGSLGAMMMTIGQAPGITEVETGRPFNAGSGKRLFEWLEKAGIEEEWFRETQYMTSVTKCYPGRAKGGGGDRVPKRSEQKLCRPFFDEEVRLVQPKLMIPIGRLAIDLFFPKGTTLGKIIGTEIKEDEAWVIPLPHPSGASRWHQSADNRALIEIATKLISKRKALLFG
jgi:uracil-DNA glycosylase